MIQVGSSETRRGGMVRVCRVAGRKSLPFRTTSGFRRFLGTFFVFALAIAARGAEFYVAPNGSSSGDGSLARPWNLSTGLGQPASVRPGDTIWLRGGVYATGNIMVGLRGTAAAPITVAQYPGERATIDIRGSARGFFFTDAPNPSGAAYVNFKNFEMTDSDPNRAGGRPVAVLVRLSDHLKFINLVVHDTGIAFDLNNEATNTEVYGSLVYYCDDQSDPRGYAHGIYIQNISGYKKAIDNIIFSNSGLGLHAYPHQGDSALLDVSLIGNIAFNGGSVGSYPPAPDILIGGDAIALNPLVDSNLTYKSSTAAVWNQQLGLASGCSSATVTNNYFVGTTVATACTSGLRMTGNSFYGQILSQTSYGATPSAINMASYPGNTFTSSRPSGTRVFVRPNQYDAGRANIAVYNWDRQGSVDVSLGGIVPVGAVYEVRNAQDFFGAPVVAAVYGGGSVRLPLTGLSTASPVGLLAPNPSGPDFNAFVVVTLSGGSPAPTPPPATPPPATPTPTPTPTPNPGPPVTGTPPPSPTPTPTRTPTPNPSGTPVPWWVVPTASPTPAAPTGPTPPPNSTPTPAPPPSSRITRAPSPRPSRPVIRLVPKR